MKILFKDRVWETIEKTEDLRVRIRALDNGEEFEMTAKRFLSDEVGVVIEKEEN